MNLSDPCTWTISSLAPALRKKEISPVEVARTLLQRIETYDAQINSFLTVLKRQALKAARLAEEEIRRGKYRGPLHGIPYAAKDLFLTRGIRTTCGSRVLAEFVPRYDAAVIERLSFAGAVLLGKLNMHEFAYGTTSVNPHYGAVCNPWDRERITGGSSGGSAAALASSFALLTLGTDTGGSIRIPSALCGVAGLKPTYGRVSRYGVYPLCWSLDHPGPMAKRVADLAVAMSVLAGWDARDPASSRAPVPRYTGSLKRGLEGIRLGVPQTYFFDRLEGEVHRAVKKALDDLKRMGARLRPIPLPWLAEGSAAAFLVLLAEAAAALEKWRLTRFQELGADVRSRLHLGVAVQAAQYLKAQRIRRKIGERFLEVFKKVDAILTPQLPITAPKIGQASISWGKKEEPVPTALTRFTRVYNFLGAPALSVPCGFSPAGLPIGLQVVGPPFAEEMVLRIGHAYEASAPWKDRSPEFPEEK